MKIAIISKPEIFKEKFNLQIEGVEFVCCSEAGDTRFDIDFYSEFGLKDDSGNFIDWESQKIFTECEDWLEDTCKKHHINYNKLETEIESYKKLTC